MPRNLSILRCVAGVTFVLLVAGAVRSEDASTPGKTVSATEFERTVSQWIRELDAPTRARRETALRQLRELGPRILPLLPAPELLPSASVRDSVAQLRGELERQHARQSMRGSTVSLKGSKPLKEWLQALSTQTGNPLDVSQLPTQTADRIVELDLTNAEFWAVLDRLMKGGDLQISQATSTRGLLLEPREGRDSAADIATSGAFRLAAGTAELRPIVGDASQRIVRIPVSITPEPRLRPLFLHFANSEVEARTTDGAAVPSFNPEAKYEIPLGESGLRASLALDYLVSATAPPPRISLSGKLWVTTAADQEPIRLTYIKSFATKRQRGIARRRGAVTVTLQRVTLPVANSKERELRVEVSIAYDNGGPAFESHRTWILHNTVYLETPDKQRFALNGGFDTRSQGDGGVRLEYRFVDVPDPLPDYTFIYVAPTLIVDAPLEFRLDSIPVGKPR